MTLDQLSVTIASNTSLFVTIIDSVGDVVVKYNAPGYEALDAELLAKTVSKVTIESDYQISVVIAE